MALKCFKLITGEEIITEILTRSDDMITVKNSMMIVTIPQREGHSVAFVPFPLHGDHNNNIIGILNSSIAYEYDPGQLYVQQHNAQFGAGLVIPSKQLIQG